MSGIELYKQLQKRSRALTRKIIFVTGDVMAKDTMSFLSRAKPAYITKPFDTAHLVKEINRVISQ